MIFALFCGRLLPLKEGLLMPKRAIVVAVSAALLSAPGWAAPYTDKEYVITVKGQRLVCKSTIQARSRIPKRECVSEEDWEKISNRTQREWHEWIYMDGGKCGQPGSC